MAMNDNGFNNNNVGGTYYSRLRFKNDAEKLSLSVYFRNGLMCFDLSSIDGDFKYTSLESVFISPIKAKMLAQEIKTFKECLLSGDNLNNKAFGVCGGMKEKVSYIAFHANPSQDIMITIGKFDGEGNIVSSSTISLNKDYHYALEWEDVNSMSTMSKEFYDNIELDQIYEMVLDFSRYMNGSVGYAVADIARYDYKRLNDTFDPLYDKLGIERRGSSGGRTNTSNFNNFLNSPQRASSTSRSLDDIEEDLM